MRAMRVHRPGGPEDLSLDEVPIPEPGPGQARVRVAYAGVNYIDVYHRTGVYPLAAPFTPGSEGSGVVNAVGEGVDELKPGDQVAEGDVVIILEAMKMETEIRAASAGTVSAVNVKEGDSVSVGDALVVL